MNVHSYIKLAAVATMIALAVIAIKRERKLHPPVVLVTKVTEMIVMSKAHAEDVIVAPVEKPSLVERVKKAAKDITTAAIPKREPTSRTKSVDGNGVWTFPYSCKTVKWAISTFSEATLEKMRVAKGERLPTAAEKQQISECLAGRFQ